jgi:hypothetical protein
LNTSGCRPFTNAIAEGTRGPQILHGLTDWPELWNQMTPGDSDFQKAVEMAGHGIKIVRYQDTLQTRRQRQYLGVGH